MSDWEQKADRFVARLGKVGMGMTMMFTFPFLAIYFFGVHTWTLVVAGLCFLAGIGELMRPAKD